MTEIWEELICPLLYPHTDIHGVGVGRVNSFSEHHTIQMLTGVLLQNILFDYQKD